MGTTCCNPWRTAEWARASAPKCAARQRATAKRDLVGCRATRGPRRRQGCSVWRAAVAPAACCSARESASRSFCRRTPTLPVFSHEPLRHHRHRSSSASLPSNWKRDLPTKTQGTARQDRRWQWQQQCANAGEECEECPGRVGRAATATACSRRSSGPWARRLPCSYALHCSSPRALNSLRGQLRLSSI